MVEPNENPTQSPEKEQLLQQIENEMVSKSAIQLMREFNDIQTDAQVLEAEVENNSEKYEINQDIPENIRTSGTVLNQQLTEVKRVLIQTFDAYKYQGGPRINIPDSAKPIIDVLANEIDVHKISDQNAIFINRIVRMAFNNELNDFNGLLTAFNATSALSSIQDGEDVYNSISHALQAKAIRIGGLTETQIDQLKTEKQKTHKVVESKRTAGQSYMRSRLIDIAREAEVLINGITIDVLNNTHKEAEIIRDVNVTHVNRPQAEKDAQIQLMKQKKIDNIKFEIRQRLNLIVSPRDEYIDPDSVTYDDYRKRKLDLLGRPLSTSDIGVAYRNFTELVNSLSIDGILNDATKSTLDKLGQEYMEIGNNFNGILRAQSAEGESLVQLAARYGSNVYSEEDLKFIESLEDVKKFKAYLFTHDTLMKNGEINWEELSSKITELFENLFEIADNSPKLFWSEAFYELTEGQVYKGLVQAIRKLGRSLSQEGGDPDLASKQVFVWDYYSKVEKLSDPQLQRIPPSRHLKGKHHIRMGIGEALDSVLANQMVDLKDLTEYSHNVQVITDQGMGFDKLKEYSSKVRLRDMFRVLASKEGLADTYSMLLENMTMELAMNNLTFREDFGDRGNDNYDRVERLTAQQLAVDMTVNSGKLMKVSDKKIKRLIRLAGGFTKGITGEFWGTAGMADMPMYVQQSMITELGGNMGENVDSVYEYLTQRTYMSLSNPGIEKMIPSLDLWKTLKRFGLPRLWQEMMSLYVPRDFDKAVRMITHHVHGNVYKLHKLRDTAKYMGRTDELAELDELIIFAEEATRTASIDLMKRGGWRFYQYRNFLVYQKDENGIKRDVRSNKFIIDFEASIRQMKGAGPYAVKAFFSDLFAHEATDFQSDVSDLSIEGLARQIVLPGSDEERSMRRFNGGWIIGSKLNKDQKSELKRILYKKYVFEPLEKTRPSHFLAMENRRWIPADEVQGGRLLSDRLKNKLVQMYENKFTPEFIEAQILPLYIGAVQLAEKDLWDRAKTTWKIDRNKGDFFRRNPMDQNKFYDAFDYRFDENVFDFSNLNNLPEDDPVRKMKEAMRQKMIEFFHVRKADTGFIKEPGDMQYFQIDDEQFLHNLKTFTRVLTEGMNEDKWSKVAHINDLNSRDYNKETMSQRYARLLVAEMGGVEDYIKGNLLDLREIDMHQAGSRQSERMFGEVAAIVENITSNLASIVSLKIGSLVSHAYKDIHEWEQAVGKELVEPFVKIKSGIENIDLGAAHNFTKKWITITALAIEQDHFWRWKGMGSVQDWMRRSFGTPASYMQGMIPHSAVEPSTAANSEQIEKLVRALGDAVQLPREEEKIKDMRKMRLFGHEFGPPIIPIYDHENPNPHSISQVIKALGVTRGKQILENLPIGSIIAIFSILILLLKQALDKNKESSKGR